MKPENKENSKDQLLQEIRAKISSLLEKKKKVNRWRGFIQKGVTGTSINRPSFEKIIRETYSGEFEEFLNSGEMQISILLARLRALEKVIFGHNPQIREHFAKLQKDITDEVIAREWLAYKSGRMSSSDFYDLFESSE